MLATLIIVFREVLEAALIVGIVLAASKGIARRGLWVAGGIAGGLLGASLVAAFAGSIANFASGMGQELLDAGVLFAAVVMLGWHNVWMARHGRDLAAEMRAVGAAVGAGRSPLYALGLVVALAVMREGSEVVLFVYSIALSDPGTAGPMAIGGLFGLGLGVAVGAMLYLGLLRISTRYLFTATSWLIVLLAAGLAAQGAAFLVQAGLLPAFGHNIWNMSAVLSERSLAGQVLHTLIGYIARPNGIELIFYGSVLTVNGVLFRLFGKAPIAVAARVPAGAPLPPEMPTKV